MHAHHNCTTATSPRFNLFAGIRAPAHRWTEAECAAYALATARSDLAGFEARYASWCSALGRANRLKGYGRTRYQGEAFRGINAARAGIRKARAALALAMANPALASDQAAA